jgi:hypothetical protein
MDWNSRRYENESSAQIHLANPQLPSNRIQAILWCILE